MGRNSLLVKNTLIISIGKVCTQLITYLLLPIYTAVLSTSEYGTIDLLLTYVILISPIITIQMESTVFRFLIDVRGNQNASARVLTNCMVCAFAPMLAFVLFFFPIALLFDFKYTLPFTLCVIANSSLSILLQVARGLGDNMTYAIGSAFAGILTVLFNVLFVIIWPFGVNGMLYSTVIAQSTAVLYICWKEKVWCYVDFKMVHRQLAKEMTKYSFPLIFNGLSWWIISASDRTIVSFVMGTDANGILAVATKLSAIVANVFAIFNLSWTESVALHINDDDRDEYISDVTRKCFNIFGCSGIILFMACASFFKYIVDEKFSSAYPLIPLLVIGGILNVVQTLYGIIYIGLKDTKKVSSSAFIAAIVNIVIDVALIKFIGLYAAAISTIGAMFYLILYRYFDINRSMNIRIKAKDILIMAFAYVVFLTIYSMNNSILNYVGLLLSIVFLVVYNKRIIKGIIKLFYSRLLRPSH